MSPSKKHSTNKNEQSDTTRLLSFDRSLPMTLLRAREVVMAEFIPALQENGLSPQQWRTLRVLEQEDGLDMSEVAKRCHLLLPSMSRIIQNLEARGLISRQSVAEDQRKNALFITKQGLSLFSAIAPKSAERYQMITRQFGEGKLEQLYQLLEDLITTLEDQESL